MSRRRSSSSSSSSSSGKRTKKKSSKYDHPSFKHMITEAIWEDKKWTKGSSRSDIRKFILQNYDVDEDKLKENMSANFSRMLDVDSKSGYPCLQKVQDLGNYKITPEWRKEWKKRAGIRPQRRKKKKDKDAPKNPRNSYLWYLQDVRESVKEKHPDKDHREITTLVAEEWKKLPAKKKKKYEDKAADDKERYEKEKKAYEKKKKRRDTSDESSSESRSRSKSKTKKRRYDSESESGKSDRSKSKRRKKGSDSESSGEKRKKRRKDDDSSESGEKKPDSKKNDDDKKK